MRSTIEDDNIPDPNAFLFNDDGHVTPQLLVSFMGNMSRSIGSVSEALVHNTKRMDIFQDSLEKLVEAEIDRKLAHQETMQNVSRIDSRINDRRDENVETKLIANKAHSRIDELERGMTLACKEKTTEHTEYTDNALKKSFNTIYVVTGAVWVISAFLITIILNQNATSTQDVKNTIKSLSDDVKVNTLNISKTYQTLKLSIGGKQ